MVHRDTAAERGNLSPVNAAKSAGRFVAGLLDASGVYALHVLLSKTTGACACVHMF